MIPARRPNCLALARGGATVTSRLTLTSTELANTSRPLDNTRKATAVSACEASGDEMFGDGEYLNPANEEGYDEVVSFVSSQTNLQFSHR